MSTDKIQFTGIDEGEPGRPSEYRNFSTPLDSATGGRLVFASGANDITLQVNPILPDLYHAHFAPPWPSVRVQGGTVTIQYRHNTLICGHEPVARVILNGSIPWEIEFRGGVAKLTADLSGLPLRALDLSSASQVMVILPQPSGTVFVHVSGSASDLTIQRPAGVAIRVHISGSASNLAFDAQHFGATADGIHWQTPDYPGMIHRYDLSVSGSVSNMTIYQ